MWLVGILSLPISIVSRHILISSRHISITSRSMGRVLTQTANHSCQDVIPNLTEYRRKALDDNQNVGTIGMDISKAFDCMPQGLFLVTFYAYGVAPNACLFISTYLKNRMQRVKVVGTNSGWATINRGVPQGSVLGPLLFNNFLNGFICPLIVLW